MALRRWGFIAITERKFLQLPRRIKKGLSDNFQRRIFTTDSLASAPCHYAANVTLQLDPHTLNALRVMQNPP